MGSDGELAKLAALKDSFVAISAMANIRFPSIEFSFGGLLGCIRGKIGEGTAAAKIAKTHHVFAAVDKVLPLQWLLQKAVFS